MRALTFDPLFPLTYWFVLTGLAFTLGVAYWWRRPSVIGCWPWNFSCGFSALGLTGLLLILLNPTWMESAPPIQGTPQLTILVDKSASMATPDGEPGQTRFHHATAIAEKFARQLGGNFDTRLYSFAAVTLPTTAAELNDTEPTTLVTDLGQAIQSASAMDSARGQVMLLLSDGIHNAAGESSAVLNAVRQARAMDIPIFTRTLGGISGVRDLAVELSETQELAFVGQKMPISSLIKRAGLDINTAGVTLVETAAIERRQVTFDAAGVGEVIFTVSNDKPGLYRYEVQVDQLPGEATFVNNYASFVLRVVDKPMRVLVLEGKPYWDGKFFLRTLAADPSVELESAVRITKERILHRTLQRTPANQESEKKNVPENPNTTTDQIKEPTAKESWRLIRHPAELLADENYLRGFQVVVLGRNSEYFLTDSTIERLRQWMARDGGALLCYRGAPMVKSHPQLAKLLPVEWTDQTSDSVKVQWTEQGRDLRWLSPRSEEMLALLPGLSTGNSAKPNSPLAVVLATGPQGKTPALSYQYYGSGRVVVIEGAGMWRWAFTPPSLKQTDDIYNTLWHSLVRWLVSGTGLLPGQLVTLRPDKVSFKMGDNVGGTLLVRTPPKSAPRVELWGEKDAVPPKGQKWDYPQHVTAIPMGAAAGAYRVEWGKLPPGRYRARVAGYPASESGAQAVFDIRQFTDEQLNLSARHDLMARIASDTGGVALLSDEPAQLLQEYQNYRQRLGVDRVQRICAWDRPWVFTLVLCLWTMAWIIRRSAGLV